MLLPGCSLTQTQKRFVNTFKHIMQSDVTYCFRIGTPVNTNMSIESFHRLLKVVYLQGKHNRRVDHLLSVLLRIARDKVFDRLTKTEKGKSTHRLGNINRRHQSAVKMLNECTVDTIQVEAYLWKVSSESQNAHYFVSLIDSECNCRLRCASCRICVHMYTCSCVDSAVHSTACKHCHIVHMKSATITRQPPISVSSDDITEVGELTSYLQQKDEAYSTSAERTTKTKYRGLLNQLEHLLADGSCDEATLQAGMKHLSSAVRVMKSMTSTIETVMFNNSPQQQLSHLTPIISVSQGFIQLIGRGCQTLMFCLNLP